ncbi:unnamed protein product, partial [Rotaria sordida]
KDKVVDGAGFVKDKAGEAYDTVAPKVAEGAEYLKDKAGEAYDAVKPKVVEGTEYLKEKADEAYKTGSKLADEYGEIAKDKLSKIADDVKASAQNFADDAVKASQEYANEGVKQGQKLGEQAFEVGKDKANEALKAAKQASIDAYEASLELGADAGKKGRKLAEQTLELSRDKANEALKAGRHAGEDAVESAQEYVKDSKKKAQKKARETTEEASEAAQKRKRKATEFYATRTMLFNCDFNAETSLSCSFIPSTGPNLLTLSANAPDLTSCRKPNRPLSDATSVSKLYSNHFYFKLTFILFFFVTPINDHMCNLPYKINKWDMHFCLRQNTTNIYTCPTFISNMSVCASGKYGFTFTNTTNRFERTYTSFVRNSTVDEQCLTFYYYFTDASRNPKIDVLFGSPFGSSLDDTIIVTVIPQTDNKWYKSETSFFINFTNYALKFKLTRDNGIDSTEFYFALDNILITSGLC